MFIDTILSITLKKIDMMWHKLKRNKMKIFLDALSRKPTVSAGTIAYIISDMQIISGKYPECEFIMLSVDPEVDNMYLSKLPYKVNLIKRSKTELGTIFQIRKILKQVDVVVSSWGDAYVSLPPYFLFKKAFFLKKSKVPLILFPSSIGPFNGGIKDYIAIRGLKKFDVITVRDIITYEYLQKYDLNSLKLVHDAAFVLKPESETKVNEIIKEVGLHGKNFIGINISILLYHLFKDDNKNYIQTMIDFIQWLRNELMMPILLIPHQIFPEAYEYSQEKYESRGGDDRHAIDIVLNKLKDQNNIYHLSKYYTPSELKGVIGTCEIFIGGRMHSIIASISQCVPSLILEYSHKASGMMKMLKMEDYVWPISGDLQSLQAKISKLWDEKEKIRLYLTKEMPAIFEEINDLADEIDIS